MDPTPCLLEQSEDQGALSKYHHVCVSYQDKFKKKCLHCYHTALYRGKHAQPGATHRGTDTQTHGHRHAHLLCYHCLGTFESKSSQKCHQFELTLTSQHYSHHDDKTVEDI